MQEKDYVCLMPYSTLFELYRDNVICSVEETRVPAKTNLSRQITDNLYQINLYRVHFAVVEVNPTVGPLFRPLNV